VLLTKPGGLPDVTAKAIARLRPGAVVIMGGTGAVSTTVENQLRGLGSFTVTRVKGDDRYGTAAAAAALLPSASSAYVASGSTFPDALAGAALAGHLGAPVLLTKATSVPADTTDVLTRLRPRAITVLGGTGVVSSSVASTLGTYVVP
jgi:putative cell wall-binding protein